MKDYKELIEKLRGFGSTEQDWKTADAIESLVRERDHKDYMYKIEYRYRVKHEKRLSAIRAAVEQVIDAWIAAGSPVAIGAALNVLEETINGEARQSTQRRGSDEATK